MDVKTIPAVIVGVMVALAIVGAVLPAFADTTQAYDTFTNDGYYRMAELTDGSHTITWNYDKPTTFIIDDIEVMLNPDLFPDGASKSVILSDSFLIRLFGHSTYYTVELWDKGYVDSVSSANNDTLTITVNSGSIDWVKNTETAVNRSFSDYIIVVNNAGNQIMKGATDSAYMLPDSKLYAGGISTFKTKVFGGIYINGTVESVTISAPLTGVTVNDDIVINTTDVNNYVDLVKLDKITFSTIYDGETVNQTYSYFVVPYEVTAERAVHTTGALTILLNVIPLMVVAGLLLGGVAWFVWKKG